MNRFQLEHAEIPAMFYQDCRNMMTEAESTGEQFFLDLYSQVGEFRPEEVDAGLLETNDGPRIYRAFVPGAAQPADCAILYMIYTEEYEPLKFLTVEISPEGGYDLLSWDQNLRYISHGRFDGTNERSVLANIIESVTGPGEAEEDAGRYGQMRSLLTQFEIPFYEDEVADYIGMFDVIGELIEHCLTLPEEVATFAAMSKLVKDPDLKSGRDKMKAMYERMDQFPASCGKMDRKAKLFFGFSVYAAHNVISENDAKRHHLYGIAEFESVEFIKYKMEEYWAMDPYMFSFAFN